MRQFLSNLFKYLIEGLVVALVAYYIPKKTTDIKSIITIGVVAALTFALLDYFAPAVGSSSRLGAGFGIGSNLVGFGSPGYVTKVNPDGSVSPTIETYTNGNAIAANAVLNVPVGNQQQVLYDSNGNPVVVSSNGVTTNVSPNGVVTANGVVATNVSPNGVVTTNGVVATNGNGVIVNGVNGVVSANNGVVGNGVTEGYGQYISSTATADPRTQYAFPTAGELYGAYGSQVAQGGFDDEF